MLERSHLLVVISSFVIRSKGKGAGFSATSCGLASSHSTMGKYLDCSSSACDQMDK